MCFRVIYITIVRFSNLRFWWHREQNLSLWFGKLLFMSFLIVTTMTIVLNYVNFQIGPNYLKHNLRNKINQLTNKLFIKRIPVWSTSWKFHCMGKYLIVFDLTPCMQTVIAYHDWFSMYRGSNIEHRIWHVMKLTNYKKRRAVFFLHLIR